MSEDDKNVQKSSIIKTIFFALLAVNWGIGFFIVMYLAVAGKYDKWTKIMITIIFGAYGFMHSVV